MQFKIKSVGPSDVDTLEVAFNIPVAYKMGGSTKMFPVVDINNITMQAVYESQIINIEFYQNQTQLVMGTYEISRNVPLSTVTNDNFGGNNGLHYDAVKIGHVNEISAQHDHNLGGKFKIKIVCNENIISNI